MDGYIEQTCKISISCTENELHNLLLELKSIIDNEPEDDYDQYQESRKLYNSLYTWSGNMESIRVV